MSAVSVISHACAICKMLAGEGFGGRKSRVMIGENGLMCRGRWLDRRWFTGALFRYQSPHS